MSRRWPGTGKGQRLALPVSRTPQLSCYLCSLLLALLLVPHVCVQATRSNNMLRKLETLSRPDAPPICAPNEELCPVTRGSDQLHCVDFTAVETCGGCVIDGDGLDCTTIPNVFMHQCTSRGQCTGCRWQKGGMNASLTEPDFLTCHVVKTSSIKTPRRHAPRPPALSFARVIEKLRVRPQPMAAIKPQNAYAGEDTRRAQANNKQFGAGGDSVKAESGKDGLWDAPKGQIPLGGQDADVKKASKGSIYDKLELFDPLDLPDPPEWLINFVSQNLHSLPFSTENDGILKWFRKLKSPLLRASRLRRPNIIPAERKRTNADRFKMALPPLPPKALAKAHAQNPFKVPGVQYTDQELLALGLKVERPDDRLQTEEEILAEAYHHRENADSQIWIHILKEVVLSELPAAEIRPDVMESLWTLLATVARLNEKPLAPAAKPKVKNAKNEQPAEKPGPAQHESKPEPAMELKAPRGGRGGQEVLKNENSKPGKKADPGPVLVQHENVAKERKEADIDMPKAQPRGGVAEQTGSDVDNVDLTAVADALRHENAKAAKDDSKHEILKEEILAKDEAPAERPKVRAADYQALLRKLLREAPVQEDFNEDNMNAHQKLNVYAADQALPADAKRDEEEALHALQNLLDSYERELAALRMAAARNTIASETKEDSDTLLQRMEAQGLGEQRESTSQVDVDSGAGPVRPRRGNNEKDSTPEAMADAFEEHVRMTNLEKSKKNAAIPKFQPEEEILQLEVPEAVLKAKRPLMAGMAKARPNAHKDALGKAGKAPLDPFNRV